MFRLTAAALLMVGLSALPVRAADGDADGNGGLTRNASLSRPEALPMLYVSLVGLQTYDVYSTRTALSNGGHESNLMMRGVANSTTGIAIAKAVSTGGMIYLAEHLWKTNHRKGAVVALLVTNGLMGAVAMHNANILSQQRH